MARKNKQTDKEEISLGKDFEAEEKMLKEKAPEASFGMELMPENKTKTLDEIWGVKKKDKFPATNEEDYKAYLAGLNTFDIRNELIKIGQRAKDSRDNMVAALLKEFRKYITTGKAATLRPQVIKDSPELRKLLNRD